mgnify:CR=1 FL=1
MTQFETLTPVSVSTIFLAVRTFLSFSSWTYWRYSEFRFRTSSSLILSSCFRFSSFICWMLVLSFSVSRA